MLGQALDYGGKHSDAFGSYGLVWKSIGVGRPGVGIVLANGEEALAKELVAKYGDAVAVTVCSEANDCIVTAG